jgi:hypothetical protein
VGPRELNFTTACLCAAATACAPGRDAKVAPAPLSSSTGGAPGGPATAGEPAVDVDPEAALGREPGDGEIVVHTGVLRGHPVGMHVGPIFGWWRGWRSTFRAITRAPVADLDWIDVVGPPDPAGERMIARVSDSASDAAIDGRLVALQARSAEPAESHVDGHLPAAAARLDGVLRVVFRPQLRFVAVTAIARGPALSRLLSHARVKAPRAEPLEAIRFDLPRPQEAVRMLPGTIRRVRGRVLALPGGDADGSADGDCDDAQAAASAAAALRDTVARQNFPLVRMLTHGLLDGLAITSEGPVVKLHLHATRDQLETVLSLATAMAPTEASP